MNCKKDNKELVSSSVPHAIQENGTFLVDLDKLANRKDVFADDNGVWIMKGSRRKSYCVEKDADGQVISLNRSQGNTDIIVRRRPYVCKSCPEYHKTIISIEYGKDIDRWYPIVLLHYYFDGEPKQFTVAPHGNRKANSTQSYVRTKESTKEKLAKNVADVKFNTKRALFQTVKEVGGVSGAASTSSLPRNYTQAKNIKQKLGLTPGSSTKSANDPLLAVLELQKSTFPGFIREVVCNDLPTIMLYTDSQLDNIVKFCCNDKAGLVSELGLDITFQLGPFYVLVSTYKNTLLNVKGSNHSPSCMGPIMICMTKEEATYLSFLHCLLREVPGLSQYLHATGTDNEVALRNATAAGFPNASALLCYLHSKRNVKAKLKELGVSQSLNNKICHDIYAKGSGLLWSNSREQFDERVKILLKEWETLEGLERRGPPQFATYFQKFKLEDMRERMAKYIMQDLGLGDEPYHQNIPEAVNCMIKEWNNFVPQDLDKFIISMFDFAETFEFETEAAWFGISEKWEVKEGYRQHLPKVSHGAMTTDERKASMKRVSKVCPDAEMYKQCRAFKFSAKVASTSCVTGQTSLVDMEPSFEVIAPLTKFFSEEELYGMYDKGRADVKNNRIREGFKQQSFLVDSGRPLPYTVQSANSGKCSCTCSVFQRNSLCHHCIGVAMKTGKLDSLVSNFSGRSLTRITTSSAPASVGSKMPPRKRQRSEEERPSQRNEGDLLQPVQLTTEPINETTLVIRTNRIPGNPVPSAPLVLKKIAGGIKKCSGCQKPITTPVEGFSTEDDQHFCFGRLEAYNYWNKTLKSYQSTVSTRHFHLNPVCTQVQGSSHFRINSDKVEVSLSLRALIKERFSYDI